MRSICLVVLLAACSDGRPSSASAPLVDGIVLDQRDDGALLLATIEPAPPGSDAERTLILRSEPAGLVPEGERALDARFARSAILVLGVDHVLRAIDAQGAITVVDDQAQPPLAVANDIVAYARGEMPFFEIARADLETGAARTITHGLAPAYSPAISEDASTIVFVSTASGAPRLHRIDAQGALTALAPTPRTPSSPIAPRLEGSVLRFHDEAGEVSIDLGSLR